MRDKLNQYQNKVIQDDCLKVMKKIPDNSIDMILCDLPYGTTVNKWDSIIDLKTYQEEMSEGFKEFFKELKREFTDNTDNSLLIL